MNNEINDPRQTLESFIDSPQYGYPKFNPKFQSFCRDKFKRYKDYIVEADWFGSGGGCHHLLFRLKSGHILAMHTSSDVCEHSYDAWESIEDYCSDENNTYGRGFGWEHESPDYDKRCQAIA